MCRAVGTWGGGECTSDTCLDHSECPTGYACFEHSCSPVCDAHRPATCPDDFVCVTGRCLRADRARSCLWTTAGAECPLGEVCQGLPEDGGCFTPEEVLARQTVPCPEGTIWFSALNYWDTLDQGCVVPGAP